MKKPTVLLILDGYGERKEKEGNAIALAKTPVMDRLKKEFPYVEGQASGLFVGLPDGQMGNSEVGHMNMGAGRIVYQELTRITKSIQDGDFFENKALKAAVEHCKKEDSALHFMGLVSSGGVHSHIEHIYGLLELAKRAGLKKVYLHAFLDGRDTPPDSGKSFLLAVEKKMQELHVGEIATISGRYYAMDRDKNYDRVEKAYRAMVDGTGEKASSVEEAIDASYAKKVYDEFVLPTVIEKDGAVHTVSDGDAMIFFNFRPDRAREICHAFCDDDFSFFERGARKNIFFVCFTDYDPTIPNKHVAFEKEEIHNTLGEVVSNLGKNQLRIAETEKYAHVTFFFNGGKEEPYENEDRILVPSPKEVPTYDLKPEMSCYTVTEKLTEAIRSGKYDLVVANFANPDMVGHTGVLPAAIKAIEVVDECMGKVVDAVESMHGNLFILADHGNADIMIDEKTGEPYTAHTTNPVPFILVSEEKHKLREGGCLADVAPTLLELMGIPQPKEMTGKSLLEK
ncbi:MAG: 2,3-bisphosphoglycerate-independent phosphoglycerate mutase [Oribacterium parvum]|jgi:2,3-bisphosphoglycerate-independent phosphoglycerate mutase|uniref:2,3-bisphosphoglycerate-independent phosphoglycerate mutase n=2 Tax=Oribacterium parvum TaxID=1501329 RepID=G9WJZ1_9FIRM|nr:2,3-bisphosphoglycerate-independent phosphoglycerate mutase [Oribacterium parvum]EHL14188.1 2,3-bisphosphoglycerate-independent phosphoglycerate mutase [Oribacterium parvum ACB1]EJF13808.1 2,3-bisphosphoglycerate-independent phosphoglycerate mutase [Oribacterium parvum ACB8]MBF1268172.1 2,3-bisphosphoglycerate-independent phosphoglycerate mutase [Oribacterium parvum]MBF1284280.1 2,3-bisphosphoglycerate-independent phosphoglycerate mutase [Oribacterium parvum]